MAAPSTATTENRVPAGTSGAPEPRRRRLPAGPILTVATWILALVFFAPVMWMVATSFKQENAAASNPPTFFFEPTLEQYRAVLSSDAAPFFLNSIIATGVSTGLVILLAIPAAYALSIRPVKKTSDVLFFFISTKMLPVVAVIMPIYVISGQLRVLDNIWTLVVLYTAMNLPIAVWMMRSFLAEVPVEMLEAAQIDGAGLLLTLRKVVAPVAMPGIAATALICFIFSWNELLLARVLTGVMAGTAPVFLTGFVSSQGLFLAKVCAAAVVISLPVLFAGFAAQDKLVQGLSLGAVK